VVRARDLPLFNYRSQMSCPWGDVNLMTAGIARFTFPLALKYLPVVLVVTAARWLVLFPFRRDPTAARRLLLLLIFSGASALSIAYFPDFIKISFVAFVFLVAAAEDLEWAVATIPAPRGLKAGAGWAILATALVASGRHLYENMMRLRRAYPVPARPPSGASISPRKTRRDSMTSSRPCSQPRPPVLCTLIRSWPTST